MTGEDLDLIRERAMAGGAAEAGVAEAGVADAEEGFTEDHCLPVISG